MFSDRMIEKSFSPGVNFYTTCLAPNKLHESNIMHEKRLDQIASRTLIMINSYLIDFTTTFADCVMIAVSQIFSLIKFQSGLHKGWAICSFTNRITSLCLSNYNLLNDNRCIEFFK